MPAVPRDWSDPFLEQAREDLRAAWAIPVGVSRVQLAPDPASVTQYF